jgi:hypothetical protein
MKLRIYFIFILLTLLLSCLENKKENTKETGQASFEEPVAVTEMKKDISSKIYASEEEEKEAMKEFIYENDDDNIKNYKLEITFIAKANFGIPGGDNWIVRLDKSWNTYFIIIYAINGDRIVKKYSMHSDNLEDHSVYDIMRDIPGMRIGDSTSSFGDFNDDGKDEIFSYAFGGRASLIEIYGYDTEKDNFVSYTHNSWITFKLYDYEGVYGKGKPRDYTVYDGPPPVEFMTYNGMYGFKVHFFGTNVSGGPGHVTKPNPKNNKWIFYIWDADKKEYVEVGEVVD